MSREDGTRFHRARVLAEIEAAAYLQGGVDEIVNCQRTLLQLGLKK